MRRGAQSIHEPSARALELPPPFRLVTLREAGDAFAYALSHAPELGAGTLVFVGRFDLAEFAVVLEPDEPLAGARRVVYAGMVALVDALAALAPPETPISIEWPDAVTVDGGLVGGGRFASPGGADENARPDWLVFGAMIRLVSMTGREAGLHPFSTALEDEGFGQIGAERLAEGFARHFMVAIDRWQEGDTAAVLDHYLTRLRREPGMHRIIAANGDLQVEQPGKAPTRRDLRSALEAPSWLDPVTGGPRL